MEVTERVSEHRRRMRERGLRPVQIWRSDVRSEQFTADAQRQTALVAEADQHTDDQTFVDSVSAPWDEE